MNRKRNTGILAGIAKKLHGIEYLPRWAVFVIDLGIVLFSLLLTYFLMNIWGIENFGHKFNKFSDIYYALFMMGVTVIFLLLYKVPSGVVRHSSIKDIIKISLATFSTLVVLLILSYGVGLTRGKKILYDPPLFFYALLVFLILSLFRFYVKLAFLMFLRLKEENKIKNVLIYGTDDEAVSIANSLSDYSKKGISLMGFISTKRDSTKNRILGKKIHTLDEVINKMDLEILDGVVFSDTDMRSDKMQKTLNELIQNKIKIYHIPIQSLDELGEKKGKDLKKVQIEDLLYRKEIKIESDEISKRHSGKQVLVTGGAGSIGSEIVRKVASFEPELIVVLDQAETPLHNIMLEMKKTFPDQEFVFYLADVSNKYRLESLFQKYNFSMVYHAAAYKHVPMIESNPHEAVNVNVLGSRLLADLSSKYKVNRFVMVSTDKAVNPTNVMGASKRVAELYVQSLQGREGNETKFITTRFGNVLGSNGSVIPLFRKQIEEGGPVTVTHKDITRFFMTIPEACELVLQAGVMGQGGEIFVFDMGESVKILDLAKKMIKLSGYEPEEDIEIVFTGLRPGEKLYEELLSDKSRTLPTHHPKIMRAKDEVVEYEEIDSRVKTMVRSSVKKSSEYMVKLIKDAVPEFISNNSSFEKLDKK